MAKDFYETLGLQKGASADEIKKAYRRLTKEFHPDKHRGDKEVEQRFKEINQAYEVLSDPEKKQQYDQFGSTGGPGGAGFDFSGFQNADFSGFGDIFENFFGGRGGGGRQKQDNRGRNLEVALEISFMDVVHGAEKAIHISRQKPCETCTGSGTEKGSQMITCTQCRGTGQVTKTVQSFFGTIQQSFLCSTCNGQGKIPEKPCSHCGGEGRISAKEEVTISVPAGIHDGQTLRLHGEGDAGRQGAAFGDLYVHIKVKEDPKFERDGDDVHTSVHIPVVDAILGTNLAIDTVHGFVTLKVPTGTQSGQVFRIKGKGLPVLNTSRHGDHFAKVIVDIPTKLSRAEKKLLEDWKEMQ